MARNYLLRVVLFAILIVVILYFIVNKEFIIKEHLSNGPPTLLTLQTDTKELDSRLTELKTEFDKMSAQAKAGADASAQARAQAAMLKNS
jgi:hypothetical protein